MIKRFFDIFLSAFFLAILFPLMCVIAILIRIDSPGDIFFRQKRVGLRGRIFDVYKFRTMVENAESMGPSITSQNDPRTTQIGHLLRWFKIDEFPQFFNVLKGDMSLVGPRPEIPKIVDLYTPEQRKVLDVKPGILGPSQIRNRDEASRLPMHGDVERYYIEQILPEKLETDLAYVRDKKPFKDAQLLFGGIGSLVFTSVKFKYILESRRRFVFLLVDGFISVITYWTAFSLRFEGKIPAQEMAMLQTMIPFVILFRTPFFIYFGLYQTLWQYLGIQELLSIIKAVTAGSLVLPFVPFLLHLDFQPRSTLIIDWFLLIMALGGSRILFKISAEKLRKPKIGSNRKNVLIVGAGDVGELLVREFIKQPSLGFRPIGFIDDDLQKQGMRIHGIKVMGRLPQLGAIVKVKKADEVIIALPEASGAQIKEIILSCRSLDLPCRIVPAASPFLSPQIVPLRLRSVDVADLLGRELIDVNIEGIRDFFKNKRVLITGAGGSIGSELAKIIFQNNPAEIILVEISENNLFDIETDLKGKMSDVVIHSYLRDASDRSQMEKIFDKHKPHIIYHAAAFKHVPITELHFEQGVRNNILGTKTVADLALENGAECFILISTDKAIRPRSVMGATKRAAELYLQNLNNGKTRFLAVRFGNVFNSRGSVVPLFRKQIEQGGPITLTHPDVTRYFIDVSEAVFLILEATLLGVGSEVFILDMGKPIKIRDLANNLIQLIGLQPEQIPIKYIGLRPGEKLEEEIELSCEKAKQTAHKKIKIWESNSRTAGISDRIAELISIVGRGATRDEVIHKLREIVPEYDPWTL